MKVLAFIGLLGMMCATTEVFASYEVIGETKDCPIQTKIIQKVSANESSLLVIHEREVYELGLESQIGSMKIYTSSYQENVHMTFEATIMGPEMSRLSELKIYLSGVMMECLIDK
jgi:hypothetical protein